MGWLDMISKRLADLNKRALVSSIISILVACLIYYSSYSGARELLVLTTAVLAGIGIWEYANLARAKNLKVSYKLMTVAGILQVIAYYFSIQFVNWPHLPVVVLLFIAFTFFLAHFKDPQNALVHISVEFFGVCYIAIPLGFMLGILFIPTQDGRWWLFYLIFVTKITDIGAYFVGKLWGRHKLAPVLSPKKTTEGAVAGFLCAIGMSLLFYYIGESAPIGAFDLSFLEAIWLGMVIGIVGQLGDLAESLLKRDAVVKDSNKLPGIGGVLDLVDALLFTTPIIYIFLKAK